MSKKGEYTCFIELTCPICGKHFFPDKDWVYNDGHGKKVCSWSCHLKARRDVDKVQRVYFGNGVYYSRRDTEIQRLAENGVDPQELAERYNLTRTRILQIIRAGKPAR
jgi:hypothetical protein